MMFKEQMGVLRIEQTALTMWFLAVNYVVQVATTSI